MPGGIPGGLGGLANLAGDSKENDPFAGIDYGKGNPLESGGALDPKSPTSPLNPSNPNSVYNNPTGKAPNSNDPKSSAPAKSPAKSPQQQQPMSPAPAAQSQPKSSNSQPPKQASNGDPAKTSAPPSSGAPASNGAKAAPKAPPDVRKQPWQEKEKACILVSGPPNNTIIQPMSKQRISWNQSPCQMSARVVGQFNVFLYNNLKMVPDEKGGKKRDYTPNGKLTYDWGPKIIATNLTNTTNNYDWEVPYLNDERITNASLFYIRVESISYSGIFGATPPLGGTYGPVAIELRDPPPGFNEQEQKTSDAAPVAKASTLPSAAMSLFGQNVGLLITIALILSGSFLLNGH
ncbi:8814_t:CDS:2 [Ambispora leptoticha]|uniref:8814_t:CDS:1 n=1 Tax=Ambispora leptoticha TaxID=144679 RepID=A0A9N9A2K7_9GLOM|nr:8814_t:CDS:2 [Ambispora leptoticha]